MQDVSSYGTRPRRLADEALDSMSGNLLPKEADDLLVEPVVEGGAIKARGIGAIFRDRAD